MEKPKLVYTTYIRTTPKKLWDAITKPELVGAAIRSIIEANGIKAARAVVAAEFREKPPAVAVARKVVEREVGRDGLQPAPGGRAR